MKRILEPELMTDDLFAKAYAKADFESIHTSFVNQFHEIFAKSHKGKYVLDIGCGTGDITQRFARANQECIIHGVDGSEIMLRYAQESINKTDEIKDRILFIQGTIPNIDLPRKEYDVVISNSLLHHLHDPKGLWESIRKYSGPQTQVFVKDLRRPESVGQAHLLVAKHAVNEPEIFKQDLFNSLLAAFDMDEIIQQLEELNMGHLMVETVGDRHFVVYGRI